MLKNCGTVIFLNIHLHKKLSLVYWLRSTKRQRHKKGQPYNVTMLIEQVMVN